VLFDTLTISLEKRCNVDISDTFSHLLFTAANLRPTEELAQITPQQATG